MKLIHLFYCGNKRRRKSFHTFSLTKFQQRSAADYSQPYSRWRIVNKFRSTNCLMVFTEKLVRSKSGTNLANFFSVLELTIFFVVRFVLKTEQKNLLIIILIIKEFFKTAESASYIHGTHVCFCEAYHIWQKILTLQRCIDKEKRKQIITILHQICLQWIWFLFLSFTVLVLLLPLSL